MYEYNNGLKSGSRTPRLYFAKGSEVQKFSGENCAFAAIAAEKYTKDGKWSHTAYILELAPGVRPLYFLSPLHGTWGQSFQSWGEVAQELQLPVQVAQEIVREEYPRTAQRLDNLEEFALKTAESGGDAEIVIISFGSPSNRAIREGFWEDTQSAKTSDGRTVIVQPSSEGWAHGAEVVEPVGAHILDIVWSPGMHGGYYAVHVAVPLARGE